MKKIAISDKQESMLQRAITWMISNLQYERHQALAHGCASGSYDKEIEEYKQLRKVLFDGSIQSRQTSD